MATFDSSSVGSDVSPSYSPTLSIQNNILRTELGDGYEQRIQRGINPSRRIYSLSFNNRDNTTTTNILNFLSDPLKGNNGASSFDWTPPYGSAGKWTCENPQVTITAFNLNDIQLEFVEVFEP